MIPDYFRLDGKVSLITGGASGIGEATARVFSEAGSRVLIVDIDLARARKVAHELRDAHAFECDITDERQVAALFSQIERLDILFNCAGSVWSGPWKRLSWRIFSGFSGSMWTERIL